MIASTHYVVDLETLGNDPRAAIVAIGIVCVEQAVIVDRLYVRIQAESAVNLGGEIDAGTVQWWLKQSAEARAEIDGSQGAADLPTALSVVHQFMKAHHATRKTCLVWGNGSSFDNVILREAFKAADHETPWEFWNDRDLRTICALYPEAKASIAFQGTKHHAMDDATHEARILCAALRLHAGLAAAPEVAA